MSEYQEKERKDAPIRNCFNGDIFGGVYKNQPRPFVLKNWENNFYQPILHEVQDYFTHNKISWWGGKSPTGHILSSQIACLNHLFFIREDKDAVLAVAKTICNDIVTVLPIPIDNYLSAFISFEAVSDNDLLNEGRPTRGSNCTSIDALILAKNNDGKIILIPMEWKYTEFYDNTDKSSQASGIIRLNRYSKLINESSQLKLKKTDYTSSIYFFEPFYQLMRQTLWAEQMIKHKANERVKADDFIHVHVIPKDNHDLLKDDMNTNKRRKGYSNREIPEKFDSLEKTWKSVLKDSNKYKIITPEDLLSKIDKDLIDYLFKRYDY